MKTHLIVLLLAALIAVVVSVSPATPAVGTDSSALRNAVTVGGILVHENALQNIANANGGTRASGTPGYDASLEYVKDQLDATGYFNVTVQEFLFDVVPGAGAAGVRAGLARVRGSTPRTWTS